jgi:uncharacterized membrane protein HdeD (DUF308 family)
MTTPTAVEVRSPAYQAFQILHIAFVVAPIAAGVDKFFHILANWDMYCVPAIPHMIGLSVHTFMQVTGVVEIVAGLIVLAAPRIGAWIVAAWLACIIVNLLMLGSFFDIALRDFGLLLGSVALARLSVDFSER